MKPISISTDMSTLRIAEYGQRKVRSDINQYLFILKNRCNDTDVVPSMCVDYLHLMPSHKGHYGRIRWCLLLIVFKMPQSVENAAEC
ncbi:hypothetical protein AVEN_91985-1 [Araneus ventricosus]|uniref:Uncharacterized protein n=1 Tax=Araneus ventricosus TaxID=182803 RepID=A0A4Y2UJ88_ARAVE|nr:hypothetical protein AVEN_91985-1 [Araneus ventricosus]